MQNLINARRQELSSAANASDVLSLMIRSSEEDSMFSMDESELVNIPAIVTINDDLLMC